MSKPKIFVVQKQMMWNPAKGELVSKFDLKPAERYGEIVWLLSPTAGPFNAIPIIRELKEKLKDYSYENGDYLLLLGNPCIIGWTVAIASQVSGGPVRLLQWSGKSREYVPIECQL